MSTVVVSDGGGNNANSSGFNMGNVGWLLVIAGVLFALFMILRNLGGVNGLVSSVMGSGGSAQNQNSGSGYYAGGNTDSRIAAGGVNIPSIGVGSSNNGVVVSPTPFALGLPVDPSVVGKKTNPENVFSGASWTRYAVPASSAVKQQIASWQPPGTIAVQSGRDVSIPGQVAIYNPETGNMWGGKIETVKELYTGYVGVDCQTLFRDDAKYQACIAAQGWRKRFA